MPAPGIVTIGVAAGTIVVALIPVDVRSSMDVGFSMKWVFIGAMDFICSEDFHLPKNFVEFGRLGDFFMLRRRGGGWSFLWSSVSSFGWEIVAQKPTVRQARGRRPSRLLFIDKDLPEDVVHQGRVGRAVGFGGTPDCP